MAKVRAATKATRKLQLSSTYGKRAVPNAPLTPEERLARGRTAFLLSNTGGNWDDLSDEDKKRWAKKGCMNHDFGKKLVRNAEFGKFTAPFDEIKDIFYEGKLTPGQVELGAFMGGRHEEPPMFPPKPESKQVIEYDFVSAYPASIVKKLKLPPILA